MPTELPLSIMSVIPGMSSKSGGPTFSVKALCEAASKLGANQTLVTLDPDEGLNGNCPEETEVLVYSGFHRNAFGLRWCPGFGAFLRHHCARLKPDVIHVHSIWTFPCHSAASVARQMSIPLIISPHGMLSGWALRHRGWKKRLAWKLFQHRDLASSQVLRATSRLEADRLRNMGFRQPVALVPNVVHIPAMAPISRPSHPKTMLFVGRLHPVKGLEDLVEAWRVARPEGWQCVIAGPDEDGYRRVLEGKIAASGQQQFFRFAGHVSGSAKWDLYNSAHVFVLPSHTENFAMVVGEALASRLPVLTNKNTPWSDVEEHRCGWWIEPGVPALTRALQIVANTPDDELMAMGERGRSLVARFSSDSVGKSIFSVYRWMKFGGPMPPVMLSDQRTASQVPSEAAARG